MPTYPYKQSLEVWINSKQHGDLTNINSKESTESWVPWATASNLLYEEAIQEVGANKDGEAPNLPRISLSIGWI